MKKLKQKKKMKKKTKKKIQYIKIKMSTAKIKKIMKIIIRPV